MNIEECEIKSKIKSFEKNKVITLNNVNKYQKEVSIIIRRRVSGKQNIPYYRLEKSLQIQLSNGDIIKIPKGFIWDLSSVPRFLWWLLPPDGDFELASLIHDYLYIKRKELSYSRKFADDEMLLWSKVVSGTKSKISIRNLDNQVRYIAVRLFGWIVYNKKK